MMSNPGFGMDTKSSVFVNELSQFFIYRHRFPLPLVKQFVNFEFFPKYRDTYTNMCRIISLLLLAKWYPK